MKKTLELFIDGACQGNPGEAGIGIIIFEKGRVINKISLAIGRATNNIAEYMALIYGLQEALILRADSVKINTDSQLLCNEIKGSFKIKNQNLKFLHAQIKHLMKGFKEVLIKQIPRGENKEADIWATKAIKKEQAKMVAPPFAPQDAGWRGGKSELRRMIHPGNAGHSALIL